jgi:hypothetical protein
LLDGGAGGASVCSIERRGNPSAPATEAICVRRCYRSERL